MLSCFKHHGVRFIIFWLAFAGFQTESFAQGQVALEIIGANVFSNCTDVVTQADIMYGVSIEGGNYLYYPQQAFCHTATPNVQWSLFYECSSELPDSLNICFQFFENDGLPFTCQILKECLVEKCTSIPINKNRSNTNYTLSINPGNDSWGDLFIKLSNSSDSNDENDLICNAIDLGSLTFQDTIGTKLRSNYQNLCATNAGDANPATEGSFQNDAGVWFRFQTRDMPSSIIQIEAASDPSNLGDPIDLELALYTSDSTCEGSLSLVRSGIDLNSNDAALTLTCLSPNQTYYLLVDGRSNPADLVKGYFGLQISAQGVTEGQDIICNAALLQSISGEGSVIGSALFSNFCSDEQSDSTSAWFEFTAPESGNVFINNLSQNNLNSSEAELALFQLGNGDCQGQLELISSSDNGQSLTASCLYPGEEYFVLVKSNGAQAQGIFNLTVADAGLSLPPQTTIESVQCSGGSFTIADSTFTATGNYSLRIPQAGTCDSIVNLNLTILDSLLLEVDITRPASNLGISDGTARVRISGGSGDYSIEWCNGAGTVGVNNLEGGQTCCVRVTDAIGCTAELCFEVPFLDKIILDALQIDQIACTGDSTGLIQFIPRGGVAPYRAVLQGPLPCDNYGTVYRRITGAVNFSNLKAGQYQLQVFSRFQDTIVDIEIQQGQPLRVDTLDMKATSCAGICDGAIEIVPIGGTAPYNLIWQDNLSNTTERINLCAGNYSLQLIDSLGCTIDTSFNIIAPPPINVEAQVIQAVSCDGASNGLLQAEASEDNLSYLWSNGQTTSSITGLGLGTYSVSVTNDQGCTGQATATFDNYEAPLTLSLNLQKAVSCNGSSDGFIEAQLTGAGARFTYTWNNGSTGRNNTSAEAGLNTLIRFARLLRPQPYALSPIPKP
ncbi:MAG: SprB repeat-containing protein [Bacteroidota bacterium]